MNHKTDMQPCPFCGCSLSAKDESGYYVHPAGQCFLREYEFDDDSIDAWNRRAVAGQSAGVADDIAEGLEILDNFIASVRENGNYSTEATLTFIGQARQCFAAPSPDREHVESTAPYDGLLEEFVDEVARLGNDAPGSRDAIYGALRNCNAVVVPADASPSRECGETKPASSADQAVYQAIADNYAHDLDRECGERQGAAYRYVVIGYGESDYPQAELVATHDELLDAVLGMMYTKPSDADAEIREAYRKDLNDEDEWCDGVWGTEFEIGGITIYDLGGEIPLPIAASAPTLGARQDAEEFAELQGYLWRHNKASRPAGRVGLAGWALAALKTAPAVAQPQAAEPKGLTEEQREALKYAVYALKQLTSVQADDALEVIGALLKNGE